MDLISEQVYLPSYRRRRNPKTTAAMVVGCAGMVYILQKRYGILDTAWKTTTRFMMNMVAAWLEDLGGTSLFTPAGMEKPEPDPANYFPSRATTQKSVKPPGPSVPGTPRPASLQSSAKDTLKDLDVPEFLMSTKFFACLDLEDSKMVADATIMVELQPHSLLFRAGDDGSEGIFVVVEGSLGMFLHDGEKLVQTNALQPGESVGDLDVIDGARRSITCMALGDGAKLVQLSRSLMFLFLTKRPSALYIYLQQAMSRLWRVANFMLSDYLQLPPPLQCTPCTVQPSSPLEGANSVLSDTSTGAPAAFVAPNSSTVGEGAGVSETDGATTTVGDSDIHQARGTSDTTTGESLASAVLSGQQPEQHGKDPSSAIEMAKALARRAAQVKEYDMLGSDTMEVVKRVLATPPMPTYGGVEWVNHWHDANVPAKSSDEGGAAGAGSDSHTHMDTGAPSQEKGNEMWYYTQQERNAGIMRPVQQLEPRPPVEAFAAAGWDCVNPVEAQLGADTIQKLRQNSITRLMLNIVPKEDIGHMCRIVRLTQGSELLPQGRASWQMLILLEGKVTLERTVRGTPHTALAGPGSILAAASFLCRSTTAESFTAATRCTVLAVGEKELENILATSPGAYLDVLFAASKALGYIIRRFVSLGLNRVWTRSGDIIYQQGMAADCLYVVISGRVRLVTKNSQNGPVHVEEEVARGQAVGAIWAISNQTHDTSAVAVRDSELVRFSRQSFEVISRSAPEAAAVILSQMASRLLNARRVRMRASAGKRTPLRPFAPVGTINGDNFQAAFTSQETPGDRRNLRSTPNAQSTFVDQKGNIVTIAIVPAGAPPRTLKSNQQRSAVRRLSNSLKKGLEEAEGSQCTIITWQMLNVWFPQICDRLEVPFYRTKVTSWMASMEEEYRFIIMEADASEDPVWAQLCVEQADLILLVATENGSPEVTQAEHDTVWRMLNPPTLSVEAHPVRLSQSGPRMSMDDNSAGKMSSQDLAGGSDTVHGACFTADSDDEDGVVAPISKHDWLSFARRTELVLLQEPTCKAPKGTLAWLKKRPGLVRHHQVRLNEIKDMARICRWIAGKAVGLVLSGGGSRGLAHLGVLQALDDVGTPVDVIGGTSQGAFMAALYAQGLDKDELQMRVRAYARAMASPRRLLSDITLPVLSVFSGKMFDGHLQETFFDGPQEIEDLWLPFFCVSTNLSTQDVEVHQLGSLWKFVRASMSIVGMLPPVINHGEMLVDGGYLNNIPVDIMHSLGVRHVIVVDVEDKQSGAWHNLTPYDGGLSGWRVLWDRYCPIPSWRSPRVGNISHPRYREMINALSWIAHSQNLRRITQDYKVDLVLSPPYASSFKLMDWHLIDSIVRDAYRYSFGALTAWVERRQPGLRARGSVQAPGSSKSRRATSFDDSNRHDVSKPWSSVSDMLHHRNKPVKVATAAGVHGERPIRVHVPSLMAAPTPRETQVSVPSNSGVAAPSITGTVPEAGHHQSHSADSLTEASAVPAIGDVVHYKESELMRMTANALEAAASHTRQASVGANEVITGQVSADGRFPSLLAPAVFPPGDQLTAPSWIMRERSFSQPASSLSALPSLASNEEGTGSLPATPKMPRPDHSPTQAAVAQSGAPKQGSDSEQATFSQGDETYGSKLEDSGREPSEGAISLKDLLVGTSSRQSEALQEDARKAASASKSTTATVSPHRTKIPDSGSPRSPQMDKAIEAAAAVWHPTVADPLPGEAPDSPSAHAQRRSGRSASKQLQTISEADNESG